MKELKKQNTSDDRQTSDGLISEVYQWNARFPIDRWWREKYKVSFLSPIHLSTCFIDMLFDYTEDLIYMKERLKGLKEKDEEKYVRGSLDYFKKIVLSDEDVKLAYDNLDLSKF